MPHRNLRARWMLLLPFIALAGWIGCAYLFGAPARTSTPSFEGPKAVAGLVGTGMPFWGAAFLIGAFVMAACVTPRNAKTMACALVVGGAMYLWWAGLFAASVFIEPNASLNGWALYAFISCVHFAAAWWLVAGRHQ